MQSAAIEVSGISETSSRLSLKKSMEQFGEVVGCHMGARGQDNPIVRYKSQEMAQAALDKMKAGEVWLDGVKLSGEWKGNSGGGGGGRSDRGPRNIGPNEAGMGLDLTSRDMFKRRDRDRSRDRDRDRDRRRSRSRRRRGSRSRSRSRRRR
eukprot:TRINITY_DN18707_c0_g1_i1.p1 TRINITY_DN18707_c0_g1~~TRINITY_DN18707_c0_g1_i1.p1  ORF type:complete len:151 (-),score=15.87 TRINITY_DN18707_c0_g1_i1:167-619(-)